jgi:hypothetical protein
MLLTIKKMRKHMRQVFAFVLMLFVQTVLAQTGTGLMPVNWDKIRAEVETNPQHIKLLIDSLLNVDVDTTLTADDKMLIVYGNTYLTKGRDLSLEHEMQQIRDKGQFRKAADIADKILAINPLNTNAIVSKIYNLRTQSYVDPDSAQMVTDSLRVYTVRLLRILDTLFMTGDGSKEHPFSVTSKGDEYNLVEFFFGIHKIDDKMVEGNSDHFVLGETNASYPTPDIYFDVSRITEMENSLSEPKKEE